MIMRFITAFSTATLFSFVATALASQPDKLKLDGVPRKAAAASLAVQKAKGKASKLLFHEGHKKNLLTPPKVKKDSSHDPDRRLTQEGSIRGGKMEDSTQHKQSLQDWNTAFEAHVAMPIRMQSMMKKASGDSNRRLQTVECILQDNGLLACVQSDFPGEGLATVFLDCPTDASSVVECQSCAIVVTADDTPNAIDLENDPQCLSCGICPDALEWDCSNLFDEGDCIIADCDGCVDDTPPPPPDTCLPKGAEECFAYGDDVISVMNCCSFSCCSKNCTYGGYPNPDGSLQFVFGTCT
jgi:hypothetical protein